MTLGHIVLLADLCNLDKDLFSKALLEIQPLASGRLIAEGMLRLSHV